ncbi:MAG: AAA family ATPase [Burkholderiaceae bacterium]|nr:AAA family ATPase [Burkholderiaceae bacterium]
MTRANERRLSADSDIAQQIGCALEIWQSIDEPPSDQTVTTRPASKDATRQLFDEARLHERKSWAKSLPRDSRDTVLRQLELAESLGPRRRVSTAPEAKSFDELDQSFPHFERATAHFRRAAALARRTAERMFLATPCLLAGPPGVGKSAFARALAGKLNAPVQFVDAASSTGFSLGGLDIGYSTGKAGRVWEALQNECMSPLVVVDELDKTADGNNPADSALYTLLEPLTARSFSDEAIGLPIDASCITWIATANDEQKIESALRSRFVVIDIPQPTVAQMYAVVQSINASLLSDAPWAKSFPDELDRNVIEKLSTFTPRQAMQALRDAYASAAERDSDRICVDDVRPQSKTQRRVGFL